MGQAAVDLPDPLNPPLATAASTDDLLAQMAGDEIDRMLAEAEADAPAASVPPAAARSINSAPAAPAMDGVLESATVSQPVVADGAPGAKPPSGSPADAAASESSDAQLDSLLEQLSAQTPQTPVHASPSTAAGSSDASAEDQSDAALAAERGALNADSAAGDADAGDAARAALLDNASPPFYLRILELLNAPLASAPDHVREAVGKVALVTLVNAASVLIYVLFFRHRHG